ncbi:uncharacterized protein DSM5745_00919 [Aspergillus mulundensis]|uniref:START domain-containing protein n=1 Tax=Aspergillus mulundensis TaxID=1810919 RepID=A0A3D8T4V1_9EURO|nr:Uncharacterized protein DSM5745_00919 [Aspergillus mulundensis]RDW93597.1 Uncharacterized protein DSM5745_00919 [Aspergillus mulundensis]
MASLQDSLLSLNATTWDAIPRDQSALREYITDLRAKARLIIDSVPEPPPSDTKSTLNNNIKLKPSPARLGTKNEATRANQKQWSKPIVKPAPGKDNPLGIPVYKLPGNDGQGHWFGRRSVHRGLPYSVWEEKLSSEMAETLKTNQERVQNGQQPDQAVRGIGAQRGLETIEIKGEDEEKVVGKVNVYHVSASFPKPTTSRDFVVMIVTWEAGFVEDEKRDGNREEKEGRSWLMVSRPVEHPEAPEGDEYIRGQYESVEMIREILVDKDASNSESESNPVEWTMVTRSDPGGTIPRWMVEKGTPKSICTDAAKFLEWASQDPEAAAKVRERAESRTGQVDGTAPSAVVGHLSDSDSSLSSEDEYEQEEHHGLIASMGSLLNAGLERYAPQAVLDYIPAHSRQSSASYNSPNAKSDTKEVHEHTPEPQPQQTNVDPNDPDETLSQASVASSLPAEAAPANDMIDASAAELLQRNRKGKLSSHERQLAKLAQEKRSVEAQIELVRSDIQSLGLRAPDEQEVKKEKTSARESVDNPTATSPSSSANNTSDGGSSTTKNRSRSNTPASDNPEMHKVASTLFREEAKLVRRLAKIERHQIKEAARVEAQHRKEAEKEEKARSRDENEALKREVEQLKKECDRLKSERKQWLGLIKALQAENTKLARQGGSPSKDADAK